MDSSDRSEEELSPETHKKSLEKLKKTVPYYLLFAENYFCSFFEENDEGLLNFDNEEDEEGSDVKKDDGIVHTPGPPGPIKDDSDDSDFELCHSFYDPTDSGAVQITQSNLDMVLASNEVVLIYFYAEWHTLSKMLMPIFDDAADIVTKAGYDTGKVVMGKVDVDKEAAFARKFYFTKYPILKLFRNGLPAKKTYRGQISTEALVEFIKKELTDPIITFGSLKELHDLSEDKRHIIGYMDRRDQPEYEVLRKVAASLRDECLFYAGFGDASQQMHPPGQPIIVFRTDKKSSVDPDETYNGSLTNFDDLYTWVQEKCIPLVREVTFENAEELTEEGLPFLILFHHPDDMESVKKYKEVINRELVSEKQNVNFLTADGKRFEHPMQRLGKSVSDLPLIAIDSFRHMYLFPDYKEMDQPGKVKQFLQDLYSGKLHREFHNGPDPKPRTKPTREMQMRR